MNMAFRTPANAVTEEPVERKLDIRKYLNFLWRQWMFIGAVTALGLVLGVIYLARATPLYTASTQVLLDPRREKAGGTENIISDIQLGDLSAIESQLTIIKSDSLLRRVVLKERLASASTGSEEDAEKDAEAIQGAIEWLRGALSAKRSGL